MLEDLAHEFVQDTELGVEVALNPSTPSELLHWLFENTQKFGILSAIAENPNTPADDLTELSKHRDINVRAHAASNPSTPKHERLAQILLDAEDQFTRRELALCSRDPEILRKLATDPSAHVREGVTLNRRTPADVLKLLVTDPIPTIRMNLPAHKNITPELLEILSKDSDEDVRTRVTWNRKTPRAVLEELAQDEDEDVRESAQDSLDELNAGY